MVNTDIWSSVIPVAGTLVAALGGSGLTMLHSGRQEKLRAQREDARRREDQEREDLKAPRAHRERAYQDFIDTWYERYHANEPALDSVEALEAWLLPVVMALGKVELWGSPHAVSRAREARHALSKYLYTDADWESAQEAMDGFVEQVRKDLAVPD